MEILKNYNLSELNTFGISVFANFFVEVRSEADVLELLDREEFRNNKVLFLGGGSNVLFTKDWEGIVVVNKIKGIEIIKEEENSVWIKSKSGEIWHDLVEFTVSRKYWGIENLALIPGTVGAAPMQNIGAYGAELKDTLESVEVIDIETKEKKVFNNNSCELGYRDSVFKNRGKGKYFILNIILKLSKKENKNLTYKILKEYIEEYKINTNDPKNISEAVSSIRRSKLPDPKVIGNAGSFFKNVFVDENKLNELLEKYPNMPYFKEEIASTNKGVLEKLVEVKIPAGWLIEECGWKGKKIGNVGVHDKQALVLVNHGGAIGKEVQNLALAIIESVYMKFGLKLVPEVNLI